MFDPRDINLWIQDGGLHVRTPVITPVSFEIDENTGRLIVTSDDETNRLATYSVDEDVGAVIVEYLAGCGRAFDMHIEKWLPKFLWADKNGHALAKAIEAGLIMMNDIIQEGVSNLMNVRMMPEWALDEKAWEYNIPYDNNAPIETKRYWVANAFKMHLLSGTPAGIAEYLKPYFDHATIEEWWEYEADPYHFRVIVTSDRTDENDAWAHKAIEQTKNLRSVLDTIIYNSHESEATGLMGAALSGMEVVIHSTTIET